MHTIKQLSTLDVLAIISSNTQDEDYALFTGDKGLYHGNPNTGFTLLTTLDNITALDAPIKLYYHHPYICVTERYGLNAAVVNIQSCNTLKLSREGYRNDVSSYSAGFIEDSGQVLLVHQTQWNRLDITNPETGQLLTTREIINEDTGETETTKWGTSPKRRQVNYIDYFHSLLHISPDGKHFLSNGWIWQPVDNIICFETNSFMSGYEPSGKYTGYMRGYAWDRPCTFINNDTFVIAADKCTVTAEEGVNESELKEPPTYHQLLYYKLSEVKANNYTYTGYEGYDTLPLAYSAGADCDIFLFDDYDEIQAGELHYNPSTGNLTAISQKGAYELTLEGKIIRSNPEIKIYVDNWQMRRNEAKEINHTSWLKNWQYDTVRDTFYRYNNGEIEVKCLAKPA